MTLTPEQIKAVDWLALAVLAVVPERRDFFLATMMGTQYAAMAEAHPDLSTDKIEDAVSRFGTLVQQRVEEITMSGGEGGNA